MASNIVPGDIYIENNYNNIFIINPNKTYQTSDIIGENELTVGDRNIKQEDLVMYANLECNIQPRSRLLLGDDGAGENTLIATSKVDFLKPNDGDFFTTNWTLDATNTTNSRVINSELLGITNITYTINPSYVPTVNITLEDIRGRALFESGDDSPYSVFFNLPYPVFYLTLKGFYGKALRMPLFLQKFNGSFNQSNGNFQVNLTFVGYKFTVLQDLTIGDLFALPKMYMKQTNGNNTTSLVSQSSGNLGQNTQSETVLTYRGIEFINKVYEDYKNLKIIDNDFPNLTVPELQYRLENFVATVLEKFGNESMGPLNDCDQFQDAISQYRKQVVTSPSESFLNLYMNKTAFWIRVVTDANGEKKKIKVYTPIASPTPYEINQKLQQICNTNIIKITSNQTLGDGGRYRILMVPRASDCEAYGTEISESDIDLIETLKARTKKDTFTDTEIQALRAELSLYLTYYNSRYTQDTQNQQVPYPPFYIFDGPFKFIDKLNKCDKSFQTKKEEIEKETTEKLAKALESDNGLGFKPTVKNMVAVFMASSEAFLRLMNEVHFKAFNQRNNETKRAVVSNQNLLPQVQDIQTNEIDPPVFPWPQFVVPKQINNEQKFEVQYPGDAKYISETGADDYNVWPEVEFVEEYLTASVQVDVPQLSSTAPPNSVNRLLISAFDIPLTNISYSNLQVVNYLYEMYERINSISQYDGFDFTIEDNISLLQSVIDFESYNINVTVSLSAELAYIFKQYRIPNIATFVNLLFEKSNNGTSEKWQKLVYGELNTKYLYSGITSSVLFLNEDLPTVEVISSSDTEKGITEFFDKKLCDTLRNFDFVSQLPPFVYSDVSNSWLQENMGGNMTTKEDPKNFFKVSKSLNLNKYNKKITNYNDSNIYGKVGDKLYNRPIVDFETLDKVITFPLEGSLTDFYSNRTVYSLTEGRLRYSTSYNGNVGRDQSTSILNTPYFINAIMEGVELERNANTQPCYKSAAYLFLNSLPLSTLREKFQTQFLNLSSLTGLERDYISAAMTRFGTIQAMPKLWVYKIGSIWHRYKEKIDNNIDIIDNIWRNVDEDSLFDPLNNNPSKNYSLTISGTNVNISLKSTIPTGSGTIKQQCLGFYPKVINDFNYFFNGSDIYGSNQSIELDLQDRLNSGDLVVRYITQSINATTNPNDTLIYPFSVLVRDAVDQTLYYTVPSFGSTVYQNYQECYNADPAKKIDMFNNQSIYNGSMRLAWGLPNFGYFDTSLVEKPTVEEHMKKILTTADTATYASGKVKQDTFALRGQDTTTPKLYDTIEELFGVFTLKELDDFEKEFLSFSKPAISSDKEVSFQTILRDIVKYGYAITSSDTEKVIQNVQNQSNNNLSNKLKSYLGDDVLIKIANPTKYDIQTNNYFLSDTTSQVTPYESNLQPVLNYNTATPNVLPSSTQTINLQNSQDTYPNEWNALKKYVGFSTISGLTYTDTGSYYTDFFIDNNIAFNVDNIILFQNLIKSYGTYKLIGNKFANTFNDFITVRLNIYDVNANSLFVGVIQQLNATIGNANKKSTDSSIIGEVTPVETYDRFKAINDKWIAGNDYQKNTLFQDVLFLDRGNRDVGNNILVDIKPIKNWIKNGAKASVETVIKSIIQSNNFVIFNIPSYINFYGVPTPTGSDTPNINPDTNFANSLFGTYSEVDYLDSRNKLVCFYSEVPSQNTAVPQSKTAYKDDTWNFNGQTPLNENPTNKVDYGISNRVVGFSVDYGIQTQSVFNGLEVSQDLGKATSESIQAEYELRNVTNNVKSSTQNVSLFNIYKTRSYQAKVECLGNAMIQPSMYFVLRNVPMFEGPYWITSVTHVITPNNFKTSFSGTRQRIAELPTNDSYLQSVRQKFLTQVRKTGNKETAQQAPATNVNQIQNNISKNISNTKAASPINACSATDFITFYGDTPAPTKVSFIDTYNALTGVTDNQILRYALFTIMYIESEVAVNNFKGYDNNYGSIPMKKPPISGTLTDYLNPKYICLSLNNVSEAYASFKDFNNFINFLNVKYQSLILRKINSVNKNDFITQFAQYYIESYPVDKVTATPTIYDNYKNTNPSYYSQLLGKIAKSYVTCITLKL